MTKTPKSLIFAVGVRKFSFLVNNSCNVSSEDVVNDLTAAFPAAVFEQLFQKKF